MTADSAAVEEWPVWLEVNGEPVVTWMCTPDQLEELAAGWLHGEGYIESVDDLLKLRPCATDLGFWAEVPAARIHEPWTMTPAEQAAAGIRIGVDYPEPIVDHGPARERALAAYASAKAGARDTAPGEP